jgi:hypothetical protein
MFAGRVRRHVRHHASGGVQEALQRGASVLTFRVGWIRLIRTVPAP